MPKDKYGDLAWNQLDIPKSGFSMLKAVQIRHPDHASEMIQLHPPAEHDLEVALQLEKDEEILGFQVKEARRVQQSCDFLHVSCFLRLFTFKKFADRKAV